MNNSDMRLPYVGELGFWRTLALVLIVYGAIGLALALPNRLIGFFNLATGLVLLWWVAEGS